MPSLNVVRMVRPHLDHGQLSPGIDAENGQRHTDVIVQIALR